MLPLALLLCATVQATPVAAQDVAPPPSPPVVNDVGRAVARGVTRALVRRGFPDGDGDTRIQNTLSAMNAQVRHLGQEKASWVTVLERLPSHRAIGFAVSSGAAWRTLADGTVQSRGVVSGNPKKTPALVTGGPYWTAEGVVGSDPYLVALQVSVLDADPKTWRLNAFAEEDVKQSPVPPSPVPVSTVHAADSAPDDPSPSPGHQRVYARNYRSDDCPDGGCLSSVLHVEYHPQGAAESCAGGSYYSTGDARCAPYHFRKDGNVFVKEDTQAVSYSTYVQAYKALPRFVKDSAVSPEMVAELANRVWRDAARRPQFSGVPFSHMQPVTVEDVRFGDEAARVDWPQVSDLADSLSADDPMGLRTLDDRGEATQLISMHNE